MESRIGERYMFEGFKHYSGDLWNTPSIVLDLVECAVLAYREQAVYTGAVQNGVISVDSDHFAYLDVQVGRSLDTPVFAFQVSSTNDVVVAFRGTKAIWDFLTDLGFMPAPLYAYDTVLPFQ